MISAFSRDFCSIFRNLHWTSSKKNLVKIVWKHNCMKIRMLFYKEFFVIFWSWLMANFLKSSVSLCSFVVSNNIRSTPIYLQTKANVEDLSENEVDIELTCPLLEKQPRIPLRPVLSRTWSSLSLMQYCSRMSSRL